MDCAILHLRDARVEHSPNGGAITKAHSDRLESVDPNVPCGIDIASARDSD
jgi:hypothetical protein